MAFGKIEEECVLLNLFSSKFGQGHKRKKNTKKRKKKSSHSNINLEDIKKLQNYLYGSWTTDHDFTVV